MSFFLTNAFCLFFLLLLLVFFCKNVFNVSSSSTLGLHHQKAKEGKSNLGSNSQFLRTDC